MAGAGGMTYDVFLSFRGEDTRLGFTGHLMKALKERGLSAVDNENEKYIRREDKISESLTKAIEASRISIVVFSENYASSKWCLDELAQILGCSRVVVPVFYHVDHQNGFFGEEALSLLRESHPHSGSDKLTKWRDALHRAVKLPDALHFGHGDGYEYILIEKIVDYVSQNINRSTAADGPVGLEYRMLEIDWLLDATSVGVRMIGIYGMGGIGKTTLASAVYNSLALQFDASCFLRDVKENAFKHGLVHLQETLLSQLGCADYMDIKLPTVSLGISIIKQNLRKKKVFIVLDDLTDSAHLTALVPSLDWFGPGSRVILTTCDKRLLQTHGVDKIYDVEKLTDGEALELLCWKAFKTDKVYPNYIDMLTRAATFASGVPLALEVIGSNLFGRGIHEMESTLDCYENIPNNQDIQNLLKISFEALNEHEKEVFLDITCFFKGFQLDEIEHILSAHHDFKPHIHIQSLLHKSLIKFDEHGRVNMHDFIQDMGREIVRQESQEHPGKRTRLWSTNDILKVLEENTGTCKIQSIILDFSTPERVVQWDGMAFMKMSNLRTLIIRKECFSRGPKKLPNSLRVLEWWGYPSVSLPSDFQPEKLAILKLPHSCFMSLGLPKYLNMRVLNFDRCEFITRIPGLSGAPNLKELSFVFCENLVEIHESVGFLEKLQILNFQGCSKLWTFPPINLTSLESINLSYCSSLVSFPEILGKMENITHLCLEYTAISKLPCSIENLIRLRRLELHSCGMLQLPSSIAMLPELEVLSIGQCEGLQPSKLDKHVENKSLMVSSSNVKRIDFWSCNISDEFIDEIWLTWFANVKELDLSTNNFTILPSCIVEFRLLRKLNLDYCVHLREIRGIPPNLETLSARRCTSLKDLHLTDLASTKECCFLKELILDDCDNLQEVRGISPNIEFLSATNCRSLTALCRRMLLKQELHEAGNKRFCLPGKRIPECFEHCSRGQSISFWFRNKFPAISLCLAGLMHKHPFGLKPIVSINGNKMKTRFQTKRFNFEFPLLTEHILTIGERQFKFEDNVDKVLSENEWNHVVVSIFYFKQDSTKQFALRTGLHIIKSKSSMDNIRLSDPYILVDMGVSHRSFLQMQKDVSNVKVSSQMSSTAGVQGLQEQIQETIEGCESVNEAERRMVDGNSNGGEDYGKSTTTKDNEVRSEKWQPGSNDLVTDMDWDPMELEYQLSYQEGQSVSNDGIGFQSAKYHPSQA